MKPKEFIPSILKSISPKLLALGLLVPLKPETKKPWLRSVIKSASNNPAIVQKWERTKPKADYAMRLTSDSIIVLDFERPGKGSELGGLHTLARIEEAEHQSIPRTGPKARSENGGEHWYFTIPVEFCGRLKNWSPVFESIDIRVRTGNVVIPPTVGRRWITFFDETDLPELPEWFCSLILANRPTKPAKESKPEDHEGSEVSKKRGSPSEPEKEKRPKTPILKFTPAPISNKEMYRLRLSKNYGPLWHKDSRDLKDQTNSCYEYFLCRMGFCIGLSHNQIMRLIQLWWAHHQIENKIDRLVRRTIPDAWEAVRERVEEFKAERETEKRQKRNSKTVNRIINYLLDRESASPSELEKALELSHSAAQMALKRMSARGLIERCGRGVYRVVISDETGT